MSQRSIDDAFEAFLAGQRELVELDAAAAHRKIPPPPGLRADDPRLQLVINDAIERADHDIAGRVAPGPRTAATTQPTMPVYTPSASTAQPPTLQTEPRPKTPKMLRWALAGAAAAAIVLTVGLSRSTNLEREFSAPTLESASQLADREAQSRPFRASQLGERPRSRRHVPRLSEPVARTVLPRRAAPLESPAEPTPDTTSSRHDRLAALELRARGQLADGDINGARRSFHKLARRAGRSNRAELAYGELFALARRAKDAKVQANLWREYLRRFPNGRFADDARAGMCRRAKSATRARCWGDYIADFPKGSHRARARRELGDGGQP